MRFCSLGSGSTGNATVVEAASGHSVSRVLVDCGFSLRELERRLARRGLVPADIDAVFVTHEHADHVGCAAALARRHRRPLWMSEGTWRAAGEPALPGLLNFARDGEFIRIGDLQLMPFAVPHDAREPLQLRCSDGAMHLGILTDLGAPTRPVLAHLQRCDALLLECNHDRDLLAASGYPASVKARIGGARGHLSNAQAGEVLAGCWHAGLQRVVAAHLSARNNHPDLARTALASACGVRPTDIMVADALDGIGWLPVG